MNLMAIVYAEPNLFVNIFLQLWLQAMYGQRQLKLIFLERAIVY